MIDKFNQIKQNYLKRFKYWDPLDYHIELDINISVVIPLFKEESINDLLNSINSCNPTNKKVELIFVINHSETALVSHKEINYATSDLLKNWNSPEWVSKHIIEAYDLPKKHAGVGLARKIGMDEAFYRFCQRKINGFIICLDGDCTVSTNYFKALEFSFDQNNNNVNAITLKYEHRLNESDFLNRTIIFYELHLRYYIQGLKFAGFPFPFHTIGSSMGVSALTYGKEGGMNKRKAGEDFYFLHKLFPLGKVLSIEDVVVYPSSRISDRVPFGTGRAQGECKKLDSLNVETYDFRVFKIIKGLFDEINELTFRYDNLSNELKEIISQKEFELVLKNAKDNSNNDKSLLKYVFSYFDGFKLLKIIHELTDNFYAKRDIISQSKKLLETLSIDSDLDNQELLKIYKDLDYCSSNVTN